MRAPMPKFPHEARTIVILHDNFWKKSCVVALYIVRPVMLSLKYGFGAVANLLSANLMDQRKGTTAAKRADL
jgi:hypothetical protein